MNKENMIGFRISVYPDSLSPKEFFKIFEPKEYLDYAWIPQTMGEQVWIWFEFDNEKYAKDYEQWVINHEPIKFDGTWDTYENGVLTSVSKEFTFVAKDHFMHNEDWLTQEMVEYWVGISDILSATVCWTPNINK